MKKLLISLSVLFVLFLTACSGTESASGTTEDGKTEIIFWHAMGGELEASVNEIVDNYNQSQDKYTVKPVYQGSYEESLTKLKTVAGTEDAPAVTQIFEAGTKQMIDSGNVQPVQKFIDEEDYDTSQWEENISSYYQVEGEQYSMPFNSSTPVLVYNKDAFKKAGLDPEKAPRTYSELKEAAEKLTIKEGEQTSQYGLSILNYGWFFEELLATQGGMYVDKENGRSGEATKAAFNDEKGQKVFELISDMHKAGTFYNVGQTWDDMRAAFQSETITMMLDSSAGVKGLVDNADFEVGVAYLPHPDGVDPQGVVIGGASLWMAKDISEKQEQATWDFMKYLSTPEVQAKWHVESGYFAINPAAYEEDLVKQEWENYPQLKVTVDQLHDTVSSPATQGALISIFPEARQQIVTGMESLYQGTDPKEALDKAAAEVDTVLEKGSRSR
ncbi:ABC transporter substrate-binding protein [Terribacillus sp. DMT04]|uniref:ABC transporter substrate-binding protein n=1 Tax=Terribacillus sp. DMT04 TaxID=2850441 RepID=UPI001C2B7F70|nr:ABC transporter substrate-binding protein [Terribacillus sp. DMT04]QXE01329.1 ABC transporter substrate-binding protein [Terribacillus sp. DMT04]